MNNLYKYLLAGLLTAGSVSCSGFLDTAPRSQLSQKTTWKTAEDAEKFLIGCYDGWESGSTILYMDCLSDFGFSFHTHEGFRAIGNGTMSPSNPGASFYGYAIIGRCNLLLKQIEQIPSIPEAQKKRIIAEAKVIRAYQYFTMNFLYGGVPIIDLPQNADEARLPRKSEAEIRTYIAKDLDEAIPDLQTSVPRGRLGKGAALALRMREALYYGDWQLAKDKAQEIISLGVYSLEPSYQKLFTVAGQGSPEIIAAVQYLETVKPLNTSIGSMLNNSVGGWSSMVPTANLVNTYEMKSGLTTDEAGSGYDPTHPFKDRDPRLGMTICFPGANYITPEGKTAIYNSLDQTLPGGKKNEDFPESANNSSKTGLTWNKYTYPANQYADMWATNACPIVFRYAEVLLSYAEAENELHGPSADVYAKVNLVRQRAGMPVVDQAKYATKEKLRELIHRERAVEFAGEGLRRADILRWKGSDGKMLAETVLNGPLERMVGTVNPAGSDPETRATINPSAPASAKLVESRTFHPHFRYLPIPQWVLDRNPHFGRNNPGY
jgi:hypothetical protein BACCOPRO_01046